MVDSQHDEKSSFTLQWVLLLALETIFTFFYKYDTRVRALCAPLVREGLIIECYIKAPNSHFYISFNKKGVFFSEKYPQETAPQLILKASLLTLVRVVLFGQLEFANKIYINGDTELHTQTRVLIGHFNLPQLVKDGWADVFNNAGGLRRHRRRPHRQLLQQLEQQRTQIKELNTKVIHQQNELKILQHKFSRLKWICIILAVALLVALATLGYWYFY